MASQFLSTRRFLYGKLLTFVENFLHINATKVSSLHDGYKFIRTTPAINFRSASSLGIYEDASHKRYFIKDYAYTLHNLEYEFLHNEINTLQILNSHSLSDHSVQVPHVVKAEDKNGRITLITDFAVGISLDHTDNKTIELVIKKVIAYLQTISQKLTQNELNRVPIRLQILTYITFPFYLVRAWLKEPSSGNIFLKTFGYYYRFAPSSIFQHVQYGLCHRDLSPDNILFDSHTKRIMILDTECMVRGDILYDIALIPRLYFRFLKPEQILSIIGAFQLKNTQLQRLIVLMLSGSVIKIATEQKGARDYIDALNGLSISVDNLIPKIIKNYEI